MPKEPILDFSLFRGVADPEKLAAEARTVLANPRAHAKTKRIARVTEALYQLMNGCEGPVSIQDEPEQPDPPEPLEPITADDVFIAEQEYRQWKEEAKKDKETVQ